MRCTRLCHSGSAIGREEIGTYVSRARTALCPYLESEREGEGEGRGREREREKGEGGRRELTGTRSIYSLDGSHRSHAVRHAHAGGPAGEGARGRMAGHRRVSLSLVGDHTCGVCIHHAGAQGDRVDCWAVADPTPSTNTPRDLPKIVRTAWEMYRSVSDRSIGAYGILSNASQQEVVTTNTRKRLMLNEIIICNKEFYNKKYIIYVYLLMNINY